MGTLKKRGDGWEGIKVERVETLDISCSGILAGKQSERFLAEVQVG